MSRTTASDGSSSSAKVPPFATASPGGSFASLGGSFASDGSQNRRSSRTRRGSSSTELEKHDLERPAVIARRFTDENIDNGQPQSFTKAAATRDAAAACAAVPEPHSNAPAPAEAAAESQPTSVLERAGAASDSAEDPAAAEAAADALGAAAADVPAGADDLGAAPADAPAGADDLEAVGQTLLQRTIPRARMMAGLGPASPLGSLSGNSSVSNSQLTHRLSPDTASEYP